MLYDKFMRAKADYDDVFEAGKKAEWNAFWDSLQQNGNLTTYNSSFSGWGWNNVNFRPKYDMRPTSAERMFTNFNYGGGVTFDLAERCEELGIILDFSNNTNFYYTFAWANVSRIGVVDASKGTNMGAMFYGSSNLTTIDKFIASKNTVLNDTTFTSCSALANVEFEGEIATDINVGYSPLSKSSITSLVNALSSSASGKTAKIKKTAKEAVFTTAEWQTLAGTKTNWTINLV